MTKEYLMGVEPIPQRVFHIFFIIDSSGSMRGSKMDSANSGGKELIPDMGEISRNNADAQIKMNVLDFSTEAQWMYDKPIDVESFQWKNIKAGGTTNFGAACEKLNSILSRSKGWMAEPSGVRSPVFLLFSDGRPNRGWKPSLEKLKGNPWFKAGTKIAIAIGDDAKKSILAEFTGNMEAVITVHDVHQLKAIIKTVSVTSAMINSQSCKAGNGTSVLAANPTQTVIDVVKDGVSSDPSLAGVDFGATPANTGKDNWNW